MVRGLEVHLGQVDREDREDLMDPEGRVVQRVRVDRDLEAHLDLEVQQGREVRVEHWDWVDRVVHLGQVVQRVRVVVGQMGQVVVDREFLFLLCHRVVVVLLVS